MFSRGFRGGIYAPKVSIPLEGKVPLGDKGGTPPCSWDKAFPPPETLCLLWGGRI